MAQPSDLAAWSTDATFTSGPESGSPTKVDPGAAYEAQGLVPGGTFVGPYVNWVLNNHYLWLNYLKNLDIDSYFLGRPYTWTATHTFASGANFNTATTHNADANIVGGNVVLSNAGARDVVYSAPRTRTKMLNIQGEGNSFSGHAMIVSGILNLECGFSMAYEVPLDLPSGCIITGLEVRCDESSATTNHASIKLFRKASNSAPLQVGSTGTHTGSAGYESINIGVVSHTVNTATHKYYVMLTGSDAAAGNDLFTDLFVTFQDPGSIAAS